MPKTHLKIPNSVAARRIAGSVLERYDLNDSLEKRLDQLISNGEIRGPLGCYREVMMQRDVTTEDLTNVCEEDHRDSFVYCILRNPYFIPRAEFQVIKVRNPLCTIS